jgi:hypothetical protein
MKTDTFSGMMDLLNPSSDTYQDISNKAAKVTLIAGSCSTGKTQTALNIAITANELHLSTVFFSLEMPEEKLIERSIKYFQHPLAGIIICDKATPTIDEVYDECKRLKEINNIQVVIIDYLQLFRTEERPYPCDSTCEEYINIMRILQEIATTLKLSVFVTYMLTREYQHVPYTRPLKECNQIFTLSDLAKIKLKPFIDSAIILEKVLSTTFNFSISGKIWKTGNQFIGIFWLTPDCCDLFYKTMQMLDEAQPYGDWIISPNDHYAVWDELEQAGKLNTLPVNLRPEYFYIPRGRVSYHTVDKTFVVYHGNWLNDILKCKICTAYKLDIAQTRFVIDEHYNLA